MPVQVKIGMQKLFIDAFSKLLKKLPTVTHFARGQDVLSDNGSRLSDLFSIEPALIDQNGKPQHSQARTGLFRASRSRTMRAGTIIGFHRHSCPL
jgi:hypothetical protein